ncbi:hypothetical protein [Rubellimicrobium aerolatum]|uniref:DUF732 domain-containing protein n=1 Tax=Rubellimicrobium aerolatum TaxID=490979 RepID=A0ABW0SBI8_9RHOB|nr:hypothetical protein [Rubellimicrobium aerolatum]MBP1805874.1 hypothetical protein [Rubellimicrobium aerolatum]
MKARTLTLMALGTLALAACAGTPPRPPQPVGAPASAAPADRFVAAIESEGCVLTSANLGAVLLRSGLTQAELPGLTTQLEAQGRLEPSANDAIRVLSDNCI